VATATATKSAIRKAGLFYFVWVMFSYCTGGPFGLEDMVTTSGPGMTLVYLLVIPFFWSIPVSLVSAELTTAMPVEGGFYRWSRAAFGDFWGFLAGWWNWCASFLLGAVYAVNFSDYLGFYVPQLTGWKHYLVSLLVVALITWINVRGIDSVGKFATGLEIFILLPVLVLVAIGFAKWQHNPFVPVIPPHKPLFSVFGVGLALGLWLYSGYEQCSTVAEEVENPNRSYPLALAIVVPLSIAVYFLPTLTSLAALGNWQSWHTGYLPNAAQLVGGSLWQKMAIFPPLSLASIAATARPGSPS
jgi:amino acid transporter